MGEWPGFAFDFYLPMGRSGKDLQWLILTSYASADE